MFIGQSKIADFMHYYCTMRWELPQSKQKEIRPHLIQRLKLSHPFVFPSENWEWDHSYVKKTKLVSVHWLCGLPEEPKRRIIQCTNWEVWYHEVCVVQVARAWSVQWICRKCISQCRAIYLTIVFTHHCTKCCCRFLLSVSFSHW